ncbi:hypothetical protein B9Z55_009588 [Caenorhabditis nigoni]|nr:hypothetical protein B9Z55_009588 [Caenorhabditis nigoni]
MEPSENEELIKNVFNNSYFVNHILDYVLEDFIIYNLDYRLVNKTFRHAVDGKIREKYKSIKLEYDDGAEENSILTEMQKLNPFNIRRELYVNFEEVKVKHLGKLFRFLKNVAQVKVREIRLKNLSRLNVTLHRPIHDKVIGTLIGNNKSEIQTFIGMDDICHPGCSHCLEIANLCPIYGPVQLNYITQPNISRDFEKLIISDYLLDDMANLCVDSSETKEACLDATNRMISSSISCHTLQLNISENRKKRDPPRKKTSTMPMPREILDLMLARWNVNHVILKAVYKTRQDVQLGNWTRKNWLTKFRFHNQYDTVTASNLNIKTQKVDIDLSDSFELSTLLAGSTLHRKRRKDRYQNFVTNVRRIFRTDTISIKFSHWNYDMFQAPLHVIVHRLFENIFKGDFHNLNIDIQLFPCERQEFYSHLIPELPSLTTHPLRIISQEDLSLRLKRRTFNHANQRYYFRPENFSGKICRLHNQEYNCTVNFTMLHQDMIIFSLSDMEDEDDIEDEDDVEDE